LSKISRETSGHVAPGQSAAPSDASTSGNGNDPPRTARGIVNIHAFQNKFDPSSTVDDPEFQSTPLVSDPHYSQPGAFRVDETLYTTQTRTGTRKTTPTPLPVPYALSRAEDLEAGAETEPAAAEVVAPVSLNNARPPRYLGAAAALAGGNTARLVTADEVNEVDREAIYNEARHAHEASFRQQIITSAVDVEIVDEAKADQQRRRRRCRSGRRRGCNCWPTGCF
jgi:hypothetical protein